MNSRENLSPAQYNWEAQPPTSEVAQAWRDEVRVMAPQLAGFFRGTSKRNHVNTRPTATIARP